MSTPEFPWRSRFIFGTVLDLTDWETTLPVRPWLHPTDTVGGSRTAASGTPAAYVVRTDFNLIITLRLYETELPAVAALIAWGQAAEPFLWYPDADQAANHEVYLEEPKPGGTWQEMRLGEYQRVMEVQITLRRVDGYAWDLDYFTRAGC